MPLRNLRAGLCCLVLLLASVAIADEAVRGSKEFAQGQALLRAHDYKAALAAFAAAEKADRANEAYRQEHALLRRVIPLRERLPKQHNAEKWSAMAAGLRSYYADHELLDEVLALDEEAHRRFGTTETLTRLASTQIRLGQDAAAVTTLGGLPESERAPSTQAQFGLALAHLQRMDEARTIAGSIADAEAGPGLLYDLACLNSLVGNHARALTLLTRCFESTQPSRLDAFKTYARGDKDLAALAALPEFSQVMATASKIKESDCSGGTSCAKCPSRDKCAGKTAAPSPSPEPSDK